MEYLHQDILLENTTKQDYQSLPILDSSISLYFMSEKCFDVDFIIQ